MYVVHSSYWIMVFICSFWYRVVRLCFFVTVLLLSLSSRKVTGEIESVARQ